MIKCKSFSTIRRDINRVLKHTKLNTEFFFYPYLISRRPNIKKNRVHLLIVENNQYVFFAKIAVLSLLYHQRDTEVVIHCDRKTALKLKRSFFWLLKSDIVSLTIESEMYSSWQEAKVALIAGLKENNELYMDADLRFRAPLPEMNSTVLFFDEGSLMTKWPYSLIFEMLEIPDSSKPVRMLNTSLVHISPLDLQQGKIQISVNDFRNFESALADVLGKIEIDSNLKISIWRLREQLYLSLRFSVKNIALDFLKASDARLDGSAIESVYFGATNLGF